LAESELGRLDFGGKRPMNENSLSSAVARQDTSLGGRRKYERPHGIAATLFYGIACNHAFENGNKRTALVCCLVSLDRNGYDLVNTSQDELFEMATQVVAHSFPIPSKLRQHPDAEVMALSTWIRQRIAKKPAGDRNMEFPKLRKILEGYNCSIESPIGNYVSIHRESMSVKIGYPRESFTVPVAEVKRIRLHLGLAEVDGGQFYDLDLATDGFVAEHREVLNRLADA
jgi:death-on-curing protein